MYRGHSGMGSCMMKACWDLTVNGLVRGPKPDGLGVICRALEVAVAVTVEASLFWAFRLAPLASRPYVRFKFSPWAGLL